MFHNTNTVPAGADLGILRGGGGVLGRNSSRGGGGRVRCPRKFSYTDKQKPQQKLGGGGSITMIQ